jgi:hypothetical protein
MASSRGAGRWVVCERGGWQWRPAAVRAHPRDEAVVRGRAGEIRFIDALGEEVDRHAEDAAGLVESCDLARLGGEPLARVVGAVAVAGFGVGERQALDVGVEGLAERLLGGRVLEGAPQPCLEGVRCRLPRLLGGEAQRQLEVELDGDLVCHDVGSLAVCWLGFSPVGQGGVGTARGGGGAGADPLWRPAAGSQDRADGAGGVAPGSGAGALTIVSGCRDR